METIRTVPCMFCGTPTMMTATRKCDGCWEVTRRLDDFVKTEAGREFVRKALSDEETWRKPLTVDAPAHPLGCDCEVCK